MAKYLMSQVLGEVLGFDAKTDVLADDIGSASDLSFSFDGSGLALAHGNASVVLANTALEQLSSTNLTFVDGSRLLVGDDSFKATHDKNANILIGGAGNDMLVGLGGNDSLDGGDGSDSYLLFGSGSGADIYHDSGNSGVDRIVAGSAGTRIDLGNAFSGAQSGIEVITGSGLADVSIVGSAKADALDFSGTQLIGIALVDGAGGRDRIVGSAGADVIRGGSGNDVIDGGQGVDVVVFDGVRSAYSLTNVGDNVEVRDLAPKADGSDGTDLLANVEILRFRDGDFPLTPPNHPPVAIDDAATAFEDGGSVSLSVLSNDNDPDAGDSLAVADAAIVSGGGTVSIVDNHVVFDPGSGFQSLGEGATAHVLASYTVQDSAGSTDTASIDIAVTGKNDAPVTAADIATASDGAGAVWIDVLANDSDVDTGDSLALVSASVDPGMGSVAVANDQLTFNPGSDFASLGAGESAHVNIGYVAQDSTGATAAGSVDVTVSGIADAPVAVADTAVADNKMPVTIDVLGNDWDPDAGDVLDLTGYSLAAGQGSLTIAGNQLIFDPGADFLQLAAGQSATVNATYTVSDPGGLSSNGDLAITVFGSDGGGGNSPFTIIDASQVQANSTGIINAILGANPGISAEPASLTATAGPASMMYYDGSLAPLGIGPGLLITSGTEPGTSNTQGYFGVDNGMPGSPILDAVVNTVFQTFSYDATMVGFTINVTDPSITGIRMDVVFGSDEFPEWVDAFVDIGVVLANGVNVAYFNNDPMAPLSVIGSNLASNYFNDNTANLTTPSFGGVAIPGVPSTYPIEYDGISPVLNILAPVHLGTNTIQIGIADTGDHIYDSGLFISNLKGTTIPGGGGGGVVIDVPCSSGDDSKNGSEAGELFDCQAGADTITANGGADIVLGGSGNDTIDGGAANDMLDGGDDSDTLAGGAGDDSLDGGNGSDTALFSGQFNDYDIADLGNGEFIVTDKSGGDGIDVLWDPLESTCRHASLSIL